MKTRKQTTFIAGEPLLTEAVGAASNAECFPSNATRLLRNKTFNIRHNARIALWRQ